jgi:16S rRNA (guanine966-N2)-methyltransferase
VREALFSSLESMIGPFHGLRVLDLFAGSGALGLEAISRGAAYALLVESDAAAVRMIRTNIAAVGLGEVDVLAVPVGRALASAPDKPFDVVLADPPYAMRPDELTEMLTALAAGWLAPDAVVVVERPSRGEPVLWPAGLEAVRDRQYGETRLWYGRPAG